MSLLEDIFDKENIIMALGMISVGALAYTDNHYYFIPTIMTIVGESSRHELNNCYTSWILKRAKVQK